MDDKIIIAGQELTSAGGARLASLYGQELVKSLIPRDDTNAFVMDLTETLASAVLALCALELHGEAVTWTFLKEELLVNRQKLKLHLKTLAKSDLKHEGMQSFCGQAYSVFLEAPEDDQRRCWCLLAQSLLHLMEQGVFES